MDAKWNGKSMARGVKYLGHFTWSIILGDFYFNQVQFKLTTCTLTWLHYISYFILCTLNMVKGRSKVHASHASSTQFYFSYDFHQVNVHSFIHFIHSFQYIYCIYGMAWGWKGLTFLLIPFPAILCVCVCVCSAVLNFNSFRCTRNVFDLCHCILFSFLPLGKFLYILLLF